MCVYVGLLQLMFEISVKCSKMMFICASLLHINLCWCACMFLVLRPSTTQSCSAALCFILFAHYMRCIWHSETNNNKIVSWLERFFLGKSVATASEFVVLEGMARVRVAWISSFSIAFFQLICIDAGRLAKLQNAIESNVNEAFRRGKRT